MMDMSVDTQVGASQNIMGETGNMDTQWNWHAAYRDCHKNMYRTSYTDMTHHRESYVKSEFPAGYGGHNPRLQHDVLFRNSDFNKVRGMMAASASRDSFATFDYLQAGVPGFCANPKGAKRPPTYGIIPKVGQMVSPWAVTSQLQPVPTMRTRPAMTRSMRRTLSEPGLQRMSHHGGFDSSQYNSSGMDQSRGPEQGYAPQDLPEPAYEQQAREREHQEVAPTPPRLPTPQHDGSVMEAPRRREVKKVGNEPQPYNIQNTLRKSASMTSYTGTFGTRKT